MAMFPNRAPDVPRGTNIVTILVGPNKDRFVVHQDPLCAASKFFDGAFNSQFQESTSKEVRLPEEHPDIISCLCDWLYTTPSAASNDQPKQLHSRWSPDCFWLELFMMADRLLIAGLKLHAYAQIRSTFTWTRPTIPSVDFITSLYKESGPDVVQQHVAEHILYWMPKSAKRDDWRELLLANEKLAAKIGTSITYVEAKTGGFDHPSISVDFVNRCGFNHAELSAEARKADCKAPESPRLLGLSSCCYRVPPSSG